jgi:hypothetical protein
MSVHHHVPAVLPSITTGLEPAEVKPSRDQVVIRGLPDPDENITLAVKAVVKYFND